MIMINLMKKYMNLKLVFLSLGLFLLNACDKDFEELNTNPNVPNAVTPDLLLPNIIRSTVNEVMGTSWGIGNIVTQQTAKIQFVNEDRYQWGEQNGIWNTMYTNLRDVQNVYTIAERTGQSNYMGIALVMKSWMMSLVTDAYGDVPYTEATQGKTGVYFPKYDTQESIYAGILADLQRANELLGSTPETVRGDILYEGKTDKWKKLANSLRLRYLMRISNKRNVGADMQAILGNPAANPVFAGNDDNAALLYLPTVPNQFPLYTSRIGSVNEFRLSKTMADKLQEYNDPRIRVFARPTPASAGTANPQYVGVPNGLDDNAALQYNGGANFMSRIGSAYYIDGFGTPSQNDREIARGIIMTYAELQFILAEAAQRGLISTGAAKSYYENGIKASFNFYKLEVPAGYLEQPGVAFSSAIALQQIGTQKWIALFYSGLEAWFDWRRTGFPALTPGPANVNGDQIPVRFIYPGFEFSLNKENVEAAVARQGANDINTKVWWDQ
jgi:hypothetical protein